MEVEGMKQISFTDLEYDNRKRITKKEEFLNIMESIIPWDEWVAIIKPYYPKGERGRPPIQIETILRMYLLQVWFNLSDEGCEDAIYDSYAMRKFLQINFVDNTVPDATTLLKFRHLLEKHQINKLYFEAINRTLEKAGILMRGGTIVDATLIEAPSSTKNKTHTRDPEMHSTKKGNQWHFGMKCHTGVDAGTGLVHTVEATAANVSDIALTHKLIREDDTVVYGDSGYLGIEKREEIATNEHFSNVEYRINRRRKSVQKIENAASLDWERHIERQKSSVRSKVEHPFRFLKCTFGFRKTVYRGISKNLNRLHVLFCCANLYMVAKANRSLELAEDSSVLF